MKILALLLFFLAIATGCSFAQNYLMDNGQNGSFVNAFVGKDKIAFYKQATIGYSINGRLDMALSGSHVNGNHIGTFYTITPSLSYLFIKQNKIPFSMAISAEYEVKRFTQTDLIKHNSFRAGASLYHRFKLGENTSLIPGAFATFTNTTRSLAPYRDHVNASRIGLQNTILLKTFSITPVVSYSQNTYLFSLRFGIIFKGANHIEDLGDF